MSKAMQLLGSKISLISKSEIRYEGILFTLNPNESTLALAKGKLFCCIFAFLTETCYFASFLFYFISLLHSVCVDMTGSNCWQLLFWFHYLEVLYACPVSCVRFLIFEYLLLI